MGKMRAFFTWVILAAAIVAALLITVFDTGGSASGTSGAGDIWWVDAPEVEQSYRDTVNNR
ncbi:MAG: hypothetical protein SCK29_08020 [Bacillota bacterium]|nr:hypothetical protein [Bacillota bacterium]MDW7684042.1 hypothetical protein [Bacillota bacterium]